MRMSIALQPATTASAASGEVVLQRPDSHESGNNHFAVSFVIVICYAGARHSNPGWVILKQGDFPVAFDAIVIGTGFGGTIAAVQLVAKGKSVLIIERGTFWRSPYPLPPITNTEVDTFGNWAKQNNMPVQYWP